MGILRSKLILSLDDKLSGPARRAEQELGRLRRAGRQYGDGLRQNRHVVDSMAASMGVMATRAGAILGPLAAGYASREIISSAANFEQKLTGIQKKAGTTADETRRIGEEIKELATSGELASSIDEIIAAYERGAAAGLPLDELKDFAALSAKAADAFEMSSEEVGNAAAGFRTSLDVPINKMERLFDLINGLADSGISDERDIVDFIDRSGAQLKMLGLTNEQIAALGATMLNLKMPSEVASRAMNTLATKLLTPKSTKKSRQAFEELYGDADAFTELLKDDANKAVIDFFERLRDLDKFRRADLLTDILGQGFTDEINRVVSAMPELMRNLDYAASQDWFGSLGKSYALKLDDFWSQWQLLKNEFGKLTIDIGTSGMPMAKEGLEDLRETIGQIGKGLKLFKAKVDTSEIAAAEEAVKNLGDSIAALMGMDPDGSLIMQFFDSMASDINAIARAINTIRDAMQVLGMAEADNEAPEVLRKRHGQFLEDLLGFNPLRPMTPAEKQERGAEIKDEIADLTRQLGGLSANAKELGFGVRIERQIEDLRQELKGLGPGDQGAPTTSRPQTMRPEPSAAAGSGLPAPDYTLPGITIAAPKDDAPQKVTIDGRPTVRTEPSGVQRVRVTNPMPAPNITVTVHAQTNAAPEDIGAAVKRSISEELNALSRGAYSDGAN